MTCAVTNGAAYSGQVIGNSTSTEMLNATYLSKAGELTSQGLFRNYGRLGNSFDIEGTSGSHVEDGFLPMLKDVNGEILKDQTPVELPDERLKITKAEIYLMDGAYIVDVVADNGGSGFVLSSIESDGIDFTTATPSQTDLELIYRGVELKKSSRPIRQRQCSKRAVSKSG